MTVNPEGPVRTFVLVPERDMGHAIAKKLREDPAIEVIGVGTDPDEDAYRIFDANPDCVVADVDSGGLQFLVAERLPPGKHRVIFFAPRNAEGCNACYEALLHGAHNIQCRPASPDDLERCGELLRSVREASPPRPEDCPAVKRVEAEEKEAGER